MGNKVIWHEDWGVNCCGENLHKIYLDECPHCHEYPVYGISPCPYCGGQIEFEGDENE